MHTTAYQRGHAQGILLYPRPGLSRPLASMLLDALHIEYGKPIGGAAYRQFLAGYADGQRTMEDQMAKHAGPAPEPSADPTVRVVASYVQRLETMLEDANARIPRWIPVSERLPEIGQRVWCWDVYIGGIGVVGIYNGEWIDADTQGWLEGVTHWQPLPAAPTEAGA